MQGMVSSSLLLFSYFPAFMRLMALIKACVEKCRDEKMLAWLYDEDRWPSGTAGGRVTAGHPEYRAMNLLWTPRAYGEAGPVKGGTTVIAFVTDPDGYKIELIQRAEHAAGGGLR